MRATPTGNSRISGTAAKPISAPKHVTQEFMGAGQMLQRLTAQVGGNREEAVRILQARGHMDSSGNWTAAGAARNAMTAAERAKDRESKRTGLPASYFKYDPKTNRAIRR